MKVLIVEDEESAAEFIAKLIHDYFADFEVVGKVATVPEALKIYREKSPDILVLDVNLGDHTSFDLFDEIGPSQLNVIFTTSYTEFAMKAIKVEAVDYLIKPVNLEEFQIAINKVKERVMQRRASGQIASVAVSNKTSRLLIYEENAFRPVDTDQIIKICADGAYSNIHLHSGKQIISSRNLGSYEKMLESLGFIRIHASCLVNHVHILSYKPGVNAYAILADGSNENVSRRRKKILLEYFRK